MTTGNPLGLVKVGNRKVAPGGKATKKAEVAADGTARQAKPPPRPRRPPPPKPPSPRPSSPPRARSKRPASDGRPFPPSPLRDRAGVRAVPRQPKPCSQPLAFIS